MRRLVGLLLLLLLLAPAASSASERRDYLWQCVAITRDDARFSCYTRLLLERVESSGDPARELPRIDREVRQIGGEVAGGCHGLMHEVGRRYGRAHRITLLNLRRYIPRSSDPTCSAGFGMGLVMYLGPELVRTGGRSALAQCARLPTRMREYTCVHGLGHALMRGYHGQLKAAVRACRALGPDGVDCAQGAFHDYWISLRGADGTTRPTGAAMSPRRLCDGRLTYVRPCWYRYFIEQKFGTVLNTADDIRRACHGLRPMQRSGCIGGASLMLVRLLEPVDHARVCGRLTRKDAVNCLRGVNVPALAGDRYAQLRLLRTCTAQPDSTRNQCYAWFGRTLNVVTNGRFVRSGCERLRVSSARAACVAGARRSQATRSRRAGRGSRRGPRPLRSRTRRQPVAPARGR